MTNPPDRDPRHDPLLDALPESEGYKVLDGRFVLYDVLGKGGMGVVYRGQHLGLGIEVAVKCLDPVLARHDPQFVVRFEKEARAAALIDDPHVVRVHDVAEASGLHYIAMQYVAGENGRQRVERKGPLPVTEAVTIALGGARGLAAAHTAGLIHRDVKPDNILISADGEVKLADLGLSKMEGDSGMTYTGAAMGTPRYMPPEQYKDAKNVGTRADVYSLGATLYFLLVGDDAIDGQSPPEVMMQVCSGDFPRVMTKLPGIAPEIDELVARCTALDPAERPADGAALVEQLLALGVAAENLREDQENMTLLGVSQVSPPPMKTLLSIQTGLAAGRTQAKAAATERLTPPPHAGAGVGAGAGAGAGVPSGSPGPVSEPAGQRHGSRLVWVLAAVLLLIVGWLLWQEFGRSAPPALQNEPARTTPTEVAQEPVVEEIAPLADAAAAPLPPVSLELASPQLSNGLWVTSKGWVRVQGQVSQARSENVELIVDGGEPAFFRTDEQGRFSFDRGVNAGEPQRFSLTSTGLAEPLTFAVVKDDVAPVIEIVSPRPAARTTMAEHVDIEVKVTEEHLERVLVGSQEMRLVGDGRAVASGVPLLRPGANVLVITATDLAGLSSERRLTMVVDRSAPVIVSVDPPSGSRLLAGSVFDLTLTLGETDAAVTVDGSVLSVDGAVARGQFSVPAVRGTWHLEQMVCDALGNCTTKSLEYTVYEETPVVVVAPEVVDAPEIVNEPAAESPAALSDMIFVGENADGLSEYDLDLGGVTMRFVALPAGTFQMGSPDSEPWRQSDEGPQHSVSVGAFLIAKYECTQAQWRAVMGDSPSYVEGDQLPVEQVSLAECEQFAEAHDLSLPSEAQWEYAARAGTTGASYAGLARSAWFSATSGGRTHPVGLLVANAFGLHDMLGNVSEICTDSQHNNYKGAPADGSAWIDSNPKRRMRRGGSFSSDNKRTRAACRRSIAHDGYRSHELGFRPLRLLP